MMVVGLSSEEREGVVSRNPGRSALLRRRMVGVELLSWQAASWIGVGKGRVASMTWMIIDARVRA